MQGADQQLPELLSRSFSCYVANTDSTSWDSNRQTVETLEQLHDLGMCGLGGLQAIKELRPVIAWDYMMPDQFCKWYRFAFHLCKEPRRKHVQVNIAIEAWSLIMAGRFRLLDKWLDFVRQRKHMMRVINEDQWRQLLDFSRSVYEDLSNFDPNGAWACCLDEFVDHLRSTRSCLWDQATDNLLGYNGMDCGAPMGLAPVSPHCGSKRRPPTPVPVDPVCDQLNNIHLPTSPDRAPSKATPPAACSPTPKRVCMEQDSQQRPYPHPLCDALDAAHSCGSPWSSLSPQGSLPYSQTGTPCRPCIPTPPDLLHSQQQPLQHQLAQAPHERPGQPSTSQTSGMSLDLPVLQIPQRRHVKPRRTGMAELVQQSVSDVFGFS